MSLSVSNFTVVKGSKAIVADACFTAPKGAVTGLIGPNGAGKSTLLTGILGLVSATGHVEMDGNDFRAIPRRERAKIAAYVEQSASTEERLSVRDVVSLGRIPHQPTWASELCPEDRSIIAYALAETGLTTFADRRYNTLSGGEQQRVHVSRALAQQPRLLLLDEPTSHLDIKAQLQLLSLLRRQAAEGMTIVLAIHDLNHAARFCDHLVVMDQSKIASEGRPSDVLTENLLSTVYGVTARIQKHNDISIFFEDVVTPWNSD
jgi:iron complex transport system ATP-binding protein